MEKTAEFDVIPERYQLTGVGGEVDISVVDGVCRLRVTGLMKNSKGKMVQGQLFTELNEDQYLKLDEYLGRGSGIPLDVFMHDLNTEIGLDRKLTEVIEPSNLSPDHHRTEL